MVRVTAKHMIMLGSRGTKKTWLVPPGYPVENSGRPE